MKKKDMIYMVLAVVIFLVAGYIAYTQLLPQSQSSSNGVEVEKIGKIPASLDGAGMAALQDGTKVQDFNLPVDLTTGLGNKAPFGP
jgi:hypothetical protein